MIGQLRCLGVCIPSVFSFSTIPFKSVLACFYHPRYMVTTKREKRTLTEISLFNSTWISLPNLLVHHPLLVNETSTIYGYKNNENDDNISFVPPLCAPEYSRHFFSMGLNNKTTVRVKSLSFPTQSVAVNPAVSSRYTPPEGSAEIRVIFAPAERRVSRLIEVSFDRR